MKGVSLLVLLCLAMIGQAQDYAKANALRQTMLAANGDTTAVFNFMRHVDTQANFPIDTLVDYWQQVYDRSHTLSYDRGIGSSALWLGDVARSLGKYTASLRYLFEAEKSFKRIRRNRQLATTYNIIGNTYVGLNDTSRQREYYSKCYNLASIYKYDETRAFAAAGLGNYYKSVKNVPEAIRWNFVSASLLKKLGNYRDYCIVNANIASLYREQNDLAKANKYITISEQNLEKVGGNYAPYICFVEKGLEEQEKGNYNEATRYLVQALDYSLADKANHLISEAYKQLSEVAYKAGRFKESADYLNKHLQFRDSVFNEINNQQQLDVQEKYETEKKDAAIAILNKENDLSRSELSRKKAMIYSGISVVALLLVLFVLVIKSNIRKNKTNALLAQQKEIIEEKQKEIVASINYARRIQYTLLASRDQLTALLPEHFILFEPRDIVSGDFYWLTHKDGFSYLAVCDCTGHGVPGAFMSLLSSNFLNEAINEKHITDPGSVLDYIRQKLIDSLDGGNDGMDAVLLKLPVKEMAETGIEIQYAAANNKLVHVQGKRLDVLPADKMPVGKGEKTGHFMTRRFTVSPGDMLYLYTDGYADQFGGPKGKKFKYKNLNQLLHSVSDLPAEEQRHRLENVFVNWKGPLEQVDDVCVLGIRL